jgi:2-C-methyl-D-erythritol 4-phosphate cytidylyltransferase
MDSPKNAAVLLPAAGIGKRMGALTRKPFLELDGMPIILHTLKLFQSIPAVTEIIPIIREQDREAVLRLCRENGIDKVCRVAEGGAERQDSVSNGFRLLDPKTGIIMVHDAVRPFVTSGIVMAVLEQAGLGTGAVPGVSPKDTIKKINGEGRVVSTPDRAGLVAVQTPQAFPYKMLRAALERAETEEFYSTDEAALVEHLGEPVVIVEGSYENIKVTTPDDLVQAETILKRRAKRGPQVS